MPSLCEVLLLQGMPPRVISTDVAWVLVGCALALGALADVVMAQPAVLVKSLLLRAVALLTLLALHSFAIQIRGLVGQNGLHPITSTLQVLRAYVFSIADPATHWADSETAMRLILRLVYEKFQHRGDPSAHLVTVVWVDVGLAALAVLVPHPLLLAYLWLSYFSYKRIAGVFLNFQWDVLLLESLVCAIALAFSSSAWIDHLALWSFKCLLLRLMLGSGMVKAYGQDPAWRRDYTAMAFHFHTQPLPSVLGHVLHRRLPRGAFKAITVATLVSELHFPLATLLNVSSVNAFVAAGYTLLMVGIALTGYFGFFNYLTAALSLSLLEDAHLWPIASALLPSSAVAWLQDWTYSTGRSALDALGPATQVMNALCGGIAVLLVATCALCHVAALVRLLERCSLADCATASRCAALDGFHRYCSRVAFLGSHYGLFANMTKAREEVVIELSADRQRWHTVPWRYKPHSEQMPPKRVRPEWHMPRLDWQMWFLAFRGSFDVYPKWAVALLISLLEGNEEVLALLPPEAAELIADLKASNRAAAAGATRPPLNATPASEQLAGDDGLWVRVGRCRCELSDHHSASLLALLLGPHPCPADDLSPDSVPRELFWKFSEREELLPPSDLRELYRAFDAISAGPASPKSRAPPSAETAQEIIMRTLFQKLRTKQQQE